MKQPPQGKGSKSRIKDRKAFTENYDQINWGKTPNPGSVKAIDMGCKCPVIDNGYGYRSDGIYVYTVGCPVHNPKP